MGRYYILIVCLVGVLIVGGSPLPAWAGIDLSTLPGSIPWLRANPDLVGSQVQLDYEICSEVADDHIMVTEPLSPRDSILVATGASVKRFQSVGVSGTLAQAEDGSLYLADAHVFAYKDYAGNIIRCPLAKSIHGPIPG